MAMSALERCKHFGVANIRGMAYMPGPKDYKKSVPPSTLYEDSDFYNNIFEELWGFLNPNGWGEHGRKDLYRFQQQLGVNFVHCYDWAAPITQKDQNGKLLVFREHKTFLKVCANLGMKATIPISNYTMSLLAKAKVEKQAGNEAEAKKLTDQAQTNFVKIISEVYTSVPAPYAAPIPGVGMWKIFNEYELSHDKDPEHVVTVMTWIAEWEKNEGIQDQNALPVMVCTSFGMFDGIEGAGYLMNVRDALLKKASIGAYKPADFWNERIVFATNPQNNGPDITKYLADRLPNYWKSKAIPAPPVMFTELGSSIEQTGSEADQAAWMTLQIGASTPGSSEGKMLGCCVFLNQQRPWEAGAEITFGVTKFDPDSSWGLPKQNYQTTTKFPPQSCRRARKSPTPRS